MGRRMADWGRWAERALDILYPPRCPYCGEVIATGERTCGSCSAEDQRIREPRCIRCGRSRPDCTCSEKGPPKYYRGLTAPFYFEGAVCGAVYRLKRDPYPARVLGGEMARSLREAFAGMDWDWITCVPMSRKKRRSRGFNQSEELARQVAGRLEIPYRSLLDLEFEPQIQHSLTAEERRANVLGAYCVRRNAPVEGCRILLVDDVFTTGSTAVECAKVLMFSGAQSVHLLCAAITLPEKRNGRVDK